MIGAQVVSVSNRRANFKFEIRRSITIVKGDSGTGKTTLFDMIASHTRLGESSGVTIQCNKQCVALVDIDWENQLSSIRDSIDFIDEGARYVTSKDFATAIQKTDNYYVFFTREDLRELPYSVDEIYQIKTSGKKYHTFKRLYKAGKNHVYSLASQRRIPSQFDTLLTEDSKAGLQFYRCRFDKSEVTCKSAGNNAGVYTWIKNNPNVSVFVVADGAAFGSEIDRVLKLQAIRPSKVTICLPESFEWLLLNSGIVSHPTLSSVLEDTAEYVDSTKHFTWEQFFTDYLYEITKNTIFRYAKNKLPRAFEAPENAEKVIAEIATKNIR